MIAVIVDIKSRKDGGYAETWSDGTGGDKRNITSSGRVVEKTNGNESNADVKGAANVSHRYLYCNIDL